MSRQLASIQRVIDISPIEGKDKIKLASILGWKVIVDSTIQVGESVVFIEVDSVLPVKPEFEFLRKRCFSESQNGFIIKTMKMGGVISQGIVFHISDCLSTSKKYSIGQDVTDIIGIKQREDNSDNEAIEHKKKTFLQSLVYRLPFYKYFRNLNKVSGNFPSSMISKSDETRIQSLGNSFLQKNIGKEIVVTEKMEGQSATYVLRKNTILGFYTTYSFRTYGRNTNVGPGHNIYNFAVDNNVKDKLLTLLKENKNLKYIAIQGEMTGPKIQKNYYNFEKHRFFVFKITFNNKEACFNNLESICNLYGFETVPIISKEILTEDKNVEYWTKLSTGTSLVTNDLREGTVTRSANCNESGFTDFSFKAVSPEYCLKRGY